MKALYYIGTIYKADDILLASNNKIDFYLHGDKKTYSDLGVNPEYYYKAGQVKNVRPATEKDFKFFRVVMPRDYFPPVEDSDQR